MEEARGEWNPQSTFRGPGVIRSARRSRTKPVAPAGIRRVRLFRSQARKPRRRKQWCQGPKDARRLGAQVSGALVPHNKELCVRVPVLDRRKQLQDAPNSKPPATCGHFASTKARAGGVRGGQGSDQWP